MYRAPSKRHELITRSIIYAFMTIGVILLVTVLVFLMLGYRFNKATSSIEQGGLVQFASNPTGADVKIGNAKLTSLTPTKITVNPGSYDVSMNRNGYQAWNKSVAVRAGEVLWLNYTQLVPNNVETKQMAKFDKVAAVKSSPNGDRFAVLPDATKPVVTFVDVTGASSKQTSVALPATVLPSDKSVTYGLSDWAYDSDHLMVTLNYDGITEYVLIDRRDESKAVNLSKTYTSDIVATQSDPRSSDRVYIRTANGDLRLIDLNTNSLSKVLATGVSYVSPLDNDELMLVQSTQPGIQSVGYLSLGSDTVRSIKKYTTNERVMIEAGTYFSEPYIAVTVGARLEVLKAHSLPSSDSNDSIALANIFETTLPSPATYLSVRSGGRFVMAQYADGVQTYDIELSKQTYTTFKSPMTQELRWLDKYHFYMTNAGNLEVMEFDGANGHKIAPLTTEFDAVQSNNGTYIYTINAVNGGFALQQSRMILR